MNRIGILSTAAALMFLLAGPAFAGVFTWDAGGAADTNWSTGTNWTGTPDNTMPTAGDDAAFAMTSAQTGTSGGGKAVVIDGTRSITNVNVSSTGYWTWSGGTLNLAGAFNYGSTGVSVLSALLGGANGSLNISSGRLLVSNASNSYGGGTTLSGTGILGIGADGTGGATVLGGGTLTLIGGTIVAQAANRTLNNGVSWGGTVQFGSSAYESSARTLTFAGGTTLTSNVTANVFSDSNGSRSPIFSGVITDGANSFSLTKTGSGLLYLMNNNTFDGGVSLAAGMILVGNAGALGTGTLTIAGNSNIHMSGASDITVNNLVTLDANIVGNASGAQGGRILNFSNTATLTGTRTIDVYRDGNGSRTLEFSGGITDGANSYGLIATGNQTASLLILSGNNTFNGGLLVRSGTTKISGDNTGLTGGIQVYGSSSVNATLELVARSTGSVAGANAISLMDLGSVLQLDSVAAINSSIGEIVVDHSSPVLLVKGLAGAGTWTAADISRQGGSVLQLRGTGTSGSAGALTANDMLKLSLAPTVTNGMVDPWIIEQGTTDAAKAHFVTYDAGTTGFKRATYTLSTTSNSALINSATATDILSFSNAGGQVLTADRELWAVRAELNGISGNYRLTIGSGGLTALTGSTADKVISSNLRFGSAGDREALIYTTGITSLVISGTITTSGGLTKSGDGPLRLDGDSSLTLSGPVTVNAGTLRINNAGALPSSTPLSINAGSFDVNGFNQQVAGLTLWGGSVTNSSATAGTLSLGGNVAYIGPYNATTISPAATRALTLDMGAATRTFDVADGFQVNDLTIGAVLAGSNGLVKTGAGRLRLESATGNTFAGSVYVDEGTLAVKVLAKTAGHILGSSNNDIILRNNGVLLLADGGPSPYTNYGMNLGNVGFTGGNSLATNTGQSGYSAVVLADLVRMANTRGTLIFQGMATSLNSNDHFAGNAVLNITPWDSANPAVNGLLPAHFVFAGNSSSDNGVATFATYTGGRVSNAGGAKTSFALATANTHWVDLAAADSLSADKEIWALRTNQNVTVAGGTPTLTLGNGGLIINDNNTIAPAIRFGAAGGLEGLVYVNLGRTATLSGQLTSAVGLTKFGGGTLVLSADNGGALGGETWINSGTLRMAHSAALGSSDVRIQLGAALELAGSYTLHNTISGNGSVLTGSNVVTVGPSGVLSPGNSVGTLYVEDLLFTGGYLFEFDETGSDLIVTDTLAFGANATLVIEWIGTGVPVGDEFVLFTYSGSDPINPNWSIYSSSGLNGTVWIDEVNNRVMLSMAPVPEPTTLVLLSVSGLALAGASLRKRRAA